MSTKKVDRTEQKKNITAQIAKATQSVGVLTSQQDTGVSPREETVITTEPSSVEVKESVAVPEEKTASPIPQEIVKVEPIVPEVTEEKKTLRGAASPNYKRAKKEKVLISARIDKQMEEEIDRICEKENMSKTDILTFALDYVLNSYKLRKLILGRNSFIDNVGR